MNLSVGIYLAFEKQLKLKFSALKCFLKFLSL